MAKVKYYMLFNVDLEDECGPDIQMCNNIKNAIPETKILQGSYYQGAHHPDELSSLWVPEDKFLIAWTIANYDYLVNDDEFQISANEAFIWLEERKNNPIYIKEFEVANEG